MGELVMIDDNPMRHLVMQKMLNKYELFKDAAHSLNGNDIIDYLKENSTIPEHVPDIILLDLNMKQYKSWLFLEDLRRIYKLIKKKIRVYIMSSSIDPLDKIRAMSYPFVKCIYHKPINTQCLKQLYLSYNNINRIAN
jgi:CheY-like chemotaxis protein